jgi:hypothetical protein
MSQYPLRFGHQSGVSSSHGFLARQAYAVLPEQGRFEEARDCGEAGLALDRACGSRLHAGHNLLLSGCLDPVVGAFASALQRVQDSVAIEKLLPLPGRELQTPGTPGC